MITAFLMEYAGEQNCSKHEFYPDMSAWVMLSLGNYLGICSGIRVDENSLSIIVVKQRVAFLNKEQWACSEKWEQMFQCCQVNSLNYT